MQYEYTYHAKSSFMQVSSWKRNNSTTVGTTNDYIKYSRVFLNSTKEYRTILLKTTEPVVTLGAALWKTTSAAWRKQRHAGTQKNFTPSVNRCVQELKNKWHRLPLSLYFSNESWTNPWNMWGVNDEIDVSWLPSGPWYKNRHRQKTKRKR
jgi:hypothetical protein